MKSITAVICVHNQHEWASRCVSSISDQAYPGLETVIVDDHSRPAFEPGPLDDPTPVVLRNSRRLGYTRSANRGLRAATSDFVLLANSDVVFPPGSLERLCAVMKQDVGICSPLSNAASWQSVPRRFGPNGGWAVNRLDPPLDVDAMDRIVSAVSRREFPVVPLLNGFCLVIKREVLDEVGLFDEASFPQGYGEENDFCIRATEAGFKCAVADDTYVYHAKSASFGHLRRWWYSRRGGRALNRKWGRRRIDHLIVQMRDNPTLAYMRAAVAEELTRRGETSI